MSVKWDRANCCISKTLSDSINYNNTTTQDTMPTKKRKLSNENIDETSSSSSSSSSSSATEENHFGSLEDIEAARLALNERFIEGEKQLDKQLKALAEQAEEIEITLKVKLKAKM